MHRLYLARFGEALRGIDANLFVPYWSWIKDRKIPDWLSDFLPKKSYINESGIEIPVTRSPDLHQHVRELPTKKSIEDILNKDDWVEFTRYLEGRVFGAHNQVHVWVGEPWLKDMPQLTRFFGCITLK